MTTAENSTFEVTLDPTETARKLLKDWVLTHYIGPVRKKLNPLSGGTANIEPDTE